MDYRIKHMVLGPVTTNCYVLYRLSTKEAIVVDPADSARRIADFLEEEGLTLQAILLTHGHFDHVGAVEELKEQFHIKVYAHEQERETLLDPTINLSGVMGRKPFSLVPDETFQDGEELKLLGLSILGLHVPGHTVGGACFYVEELKLLFSGDCLFAGSIGRTDFAGGSMSQLVHGIEEKLFALPDDVKVFPGHGEQTSIGYEKKYNPFLRG